MSLHPSARVYVAAKNMRGAWAARPKDSVVVDVTSAQAKNAPNRLCFSPMTMSAYTDADEGTFPNFEAYWQSLKVIENAPHAEAKQWWKAIQKPKRRHPKMKQNRVLHAKHLRFPGEELGYVESRKKIYVPDYFDIIKNSAHFVAMRDDVGKSAGKAFVVYDFDGPRDEGGAPAIEEVSVEMLKRQINNERFPFGHGYVVAAALAGIAPAAYC
jgi:hypothetical protein